MMNCLLFILGLSLGGPSQASIPPGEMQILKPSERESLRFHLENLANEMELLFQNQKVNQADLRRQEHSLSELKVYERIPLNENTSKLRNDLKKHAEEYELKLASFKETHRSPKPKPLPASIYTDNSKFRLTPDVLVEEIHYELRVNGTETNVNRWVSSWLSQFMRIMELDIEYTPIQSVKPGLWKIQAHCFRFRDIQYPSIKPRNPRSYLPIQAQQNFALFQTKEPTLAQFITRIEALAPKSGPFLKVRERFLLNDARLSFYLSKATSKDLERK